MCRPELVAFPSKQEKESSFWQLSSLIHLTRQPCVFPGKSRSSGAQIDQSWAGSRKGNEGRGPGFAELTSPKWMMEPSPVAMEWEVPVWDAFSEEVVLSFWLGFSFFHFEVVPPSVYCGKEFLRASPFLKCTRAFDSHVSFPGKEAHPPIALEFTTAGIHCLNFHLNNYLPVHATIMGLPAEPSK